MAALFFGVGGAAALATGIYDEPLVAALAGFLVCIFSLAVHETAHLVILRLVVKDREAGHVRFSLANVWISAPRMSGIQNISTAAAGPVFGSLTCLGFLAMGVPAWISAPLAAVHLLNLLPLFPDGRMILVGFGQLLLGAKLGSQVGRQADTRL